VVGELYIGGDGLARGYLHRPGLSSERFVPSPFVPGARIYRTGDLARWRSDGVLECLGRTDHQVKIRGYRIELGEIEAAVSKHPAVHQAVVVAREDTPGDKRLVAYVVAPEAPRDLPEQLRTLLRGALPDYMVPAHYVTLDAFPLTPNGKVDRKALPPPDVSATAAAAGDFAAPRNDVEISLAAAWERVLGVPRVGITDDFFELGGTSLTVLKLLVEMKNATGIDIGLDAVFRFPTIARLVESLGAAATTGASALVPLQPAGDGTPVFCLCGINLYREFAKSLGTDQPVYGVYVAEEQGIVDQALGGGKVDVSVRQLADAYCKAIQRAAPHGPYRLAGISFGGVLAMEVASMMRRAGAPVEAVILLDTILPGAMRRSWARWCFSQLAQVARGELKTVLRRNLAKVRIRLGSGRTGGDGDALAQVDQAFARRQDALYDAIGTWQTKELFSDFDVILFRTVDGAWGDHVDVEADYGWGPLVTGRLEVVRAPGDHLGIIAPPGVAALGATARDFLERARTRASASEAPGEPNLARRPA
jgi:thioesterase domain-containing protein